jgi:16S rRNA processing protein RimM
MYFIGNIHSKPTHKVGFVMKTNGFKGWMRIFLNTDATCIPQKGEFLFLNPEGKWVPFLIEDVSDSASLVKLRHIDTVTDANKYIGCDLVEFIDAENHQNIEDTGFRGYEVFDEKKILKGTVIQLINMPGHDVLEIDCNNQKVLVPFHESLIIDIDDDARTIVLKWPEGLEEL